MPDTPLLSLGILNNDRHKWSDFQETMKTTLSEMRIPDRKVMIKPLPNVNNPLLYKRLNNINNNSSAMFGTSMSFDDQPRQLTLLNDDNTNSNNANNDTIMDNSDGQSLVQTGNFVDTNMSDFVETPPVFYSHFNQPGSMNTPVILPQNQAWPTMDDFTTPEIENIAKQLLK